MQKADCPQCGKNIVVGSHPTIGKIIQCEGCGSELEIVWLDPIEMDWPFIDDDDTSDEFEED